MTVLYVAVEDQHLGLLDVFALLPEGQHARHPVNSCVLLIKRYWSRNKLLMCPSLNMKEDHIVAGLLDIEVGATNTIRRILFKININVEEAVCVDSEYIVFDLLSCRLETIVLVVFDQFLGLLF